MGTGRLIAALLVICSFNNNTRAGVLSVDNGVSGAGHVDIGVDDYGAYGNWIGPNNNDSYDVAGATSSQAPTFLSGAYLVTRTAGATDPPVVLLTELTKWLKIVEPDGDQDGIGGAPVLLRTITTENTRIGPNEVRSAFTIGEAGATGIQVAIELQQTLTYDDTTSTTRFDQAYTITNIGTVALDLVFHSVWDPDLLWTNFDDDLVGVGDGLCYVFTEEPTGEPDRRFALTDGGSSVPFTYYTAAQKGQDPPQPPPFETSNRSTDVFVGKGMPESWRNWGGELGYSTAGRSTAGGDAALALEYRFTLAPNDPAVRIVTRRIYGTSTLPCPASTSCGNSAVESAEACDTGGQDTAECNGATCTPPTCGDGHVNTAAGEACESGGQDTAACDGATCTVPACGDGYANAAAGEACDEGEDTPTCNAMTCTVPACGDGYVNAAAGEDCEDGELCDLATCRATFTLGGGCAGCGATGGAAPASLVALVALVLGRRRRRN